MPENQQLQLHLATTTKALAKSEDDNRNMLAKFNNLELKVQTLLQRRHSEDTEPHTRTPSSSTTNHLDFLNTPHKENNFKQPMDNTE